MANLNFNRVTIAGKVTADIELKTTSSGQRVASCSVAVNRTKEAADFIPVTFWDNNAELAASHFRKGSSILIEGRMQSRTYDKNGEKRTAWDVVADRVYFVDTKAEAAAAGTAASTPAPAGEAVPSTAKFEDVPNDADLPF